MESRLGKRAYEAYCKSTGGVSLVSGEKLPEFGKLKESIQVAWRDAAWAVAIPCGYQPEERFGD
jgi:hypothetical protein